jgi:hypothetical protein
MFLKSLLFHQKKRTSSSGQMAWMASEKPHVIDILQREVGVFSHESIGMPVSSRTEFNPN